MAKVEPCRVLRTATASIGMDSLLSMPLGKGVHLCLENVFMVEAML